MSGSRFVVETRRGNFLINAEADRCGPWRRPNASTQKMRRTIGATSSRRGSGRTVDAFSR